MSPILINTGTSQTPIPSSRSLQPQETSTTASIDKSDDDSDNEAREERKATGRSIAIVIFLSLICLAIYHVIQKKTTVLAGVLVPALILFSYTFFVIHISQKDKKKRRKQLESINDLELSVSSVDQKSQKNISLIPNPSISSATSSSLPSTSGLVMSRPLGKKVVDPRLAIIAKNANVPMTHKSTHHHHHLSPNDKKKPFKKAQSHSHIQINKINPTMPVATAQLTMQHETKKLKKSRSFDKNNYHAAHGSGSHVMESKRPKPNLIK